MVTVLTNNEVEEEEGVSERNMALRLFEEIGNSAKQVSDIVSRLEGKLKEGELPTDKGLNLLDIKNYLMVEYLSSMAHLVSLKASGSSIEGQPDIDRLIEVRVVLERLRPIEEKTKYTIEKLLKTAATGSLASDDPTRFRANPGALQSTSNEVASDESEIEDDEEESSGEEEEGGKVDGKKGKALDKKGEKRSSGVYKPPKLAAVHYDGDITGEERRARALERARRYALNSSVMAELREEYLDTPTVITATNTARQREDMKQKRKTEYEENYMTRLPVTKEERKKNARLSTLGTIGNEVTHFEDISVLEDGVLRSTKKRKRAAPKQGKNKKKKKRRRHF